MWAVESGCQVCVAFLGLLRRIQGLGLGHTPGTRIKRLQCRNGLFVLVVFSAMVYGGSGFEDPKVSGRIRCLTLVGTLAQNKHGS